MTLLIMNQAMSYFVRILNTCPKSRKYNLRIKNLRNENPASLSWALLEAKCIMMTPSPLLSFLVPCSHSKCTRNRPVRMGRQLWQGNRNCAGPLLALLVNDQLPPPIREETAGSAHEDRAPEIWIVRFQSEPVFLSQGSKGHPARLHSKGGVTSN